METSSGINGLLGKVVHFETEWLVDGGLCETNTLSSKDDVYGGHYFLIFELLPHGLCQMVPLHHLAGNNRRKLDPNLKSGAGEEWGKPTYVYRWQTWKAPASLIQQLILQYRNKAEDQRSYAAERPDILASLAVWLNANKNDWHAAADNRPS